MQNIHCSWSHVWHHWIMSLTMASSMHVLYLITGSIEQRLMPFTLDRPVQWTVTALNLVMAACVPPAPYQRQILLFLLTLCRPSPVRPSRHETLWPSSRSLPHGRICLLSGRFKMLSWSRSDPPSSCSGFQLSLALFFSLYSQKFRSPHVPACVRFLAMDSGTVRRYSVGICMYMALFWLGTNIVLVYTAVTDLRQKLSHSVDTFKWSSISFVK